MGAWVPASWPTPGQPEPSTVSVVGEIAFNEILPDAVGNDTSSWPNGEWIELINLGNQTVDIANWHFSSGSRNFNINAHQLPLKSDTMVNPGEVVLVAINGSQGFYLRNTNPDTIELRDSTNQIISTITYNSSTEGESNWFWNGDWSQAPWPHLVQQTLKLRLTPAMIPLKSPRFLHTVHLEVSPLQTTG